MDLSVDGHTGGQTEKCLEVIGIITNRNVIPSDAGDSAKVSGLRLGTAAVTTRGMGKLEMKQIANLIAAVCAVLKTLKR